MALTFQFWTRIVTLEVLPEEIMTDESQKNYAELRPRRQGQGGEGCPGTSSEARDEHFEDFPISVNGSKHGIYFTSRRAGYYKGMRVFVPFTSAHDLMKSEYLAEVKRVEDLPHGRFGIAVRLLMTV